MAWHIEQQGERHCVVDSSTGEVIQCYQFEEAAGTHVQALYANVSDMRAPSAPGNMRRATQGIKRAGWLEESMINMAKK